jgi:hypothetical protein
MTTHDIAEQARQQAQARAAGQKERAADSLGRVAQALRQSSQQLRDQDQGTLAQYTEKAADQVERFSGALRNKDVNQLVGEAEHFARQQPGIFLGGAFALGLLAARFLKSSRQQAAAGGGRTPPRAATPTYGTRTYPGGAEETRTDVPGGVGTLAVETPPYEPRVRPEYTEGVAETRTYEPPVRPEYTEGTAEPRRGEPSPRSGYAPGMEET